MKFNSLFLFFWGVQLVIFPITHDAAASCVGLTLEDMGNGGYKVIARGLVNVSALDFTLTYDKASLASPRVVRGDMADWLIFVPNIAENSGTVRVAMVKEPPVSGSGTVATVTFAPVGKAWGKPVLTCTLTGLDDSNQPTNNPSTSTNEQKDQSPSEDASQTAELTNQKTSSEETVSTVSSTGLGSINLGTVGALEEQSQPLEQSLPLAQEPAATVTVEQSDQWQSDAGAVEGMVEEYETQSAPLRPSQPIAVPVQANKYDAFKGVLDRFREYTGDRTPTAFMALFDQPVAASIKQDPAICINDGKMMLKILIDLPESSMHAPNFALRGASLKSLKKLGDNRWMLEAYPDAGRVEAMLTIVNGEQVTDYPFTVAPKADVNIDRNGVTDEADFSLFLSRMGTGNVLAYDLNGDGRRDYVDDYIYTANYLVVHGDKKSKK